jgi:3,4-dihydroxy-2-butanone 4-phosphate synthase
MTGSGYICISLPSEKLEELEIPMMVNQNEDPHRTAYTVTVDYKFGAASIFWQRSRLKRLLTYTV